jgi:hypothetical protein
VDSYCKKLSTDWKKIKENAYRLLSQFSLVLGKRAALEGRIGELERSMDPRAQRGSADQVRVARFS